MRVSVAHTALPPISEANGTGSGVGGSLDPREPRRSLRNLRPPPPPDQPRRYTTQLRAGSLATAASATTAAASERHRQSWRRASSIRSSENPQGAAAGKASRQENTYRTGPTRPFQLEAAEAVIKERLAGLLKNYTYTALSAPNYTVHLTQEIKNKVKQELSSAQQRYKLVVLVTIAEPSAPAGISAARALWSAETGDACARAEFRNARVAAYAAVFAFYCE